ncbi:MAG TPA: helix-turn-helix domain-containing protein [Acidiferrobacterales bacterium]
MDELAIKLNPYALPAILAFIGKLGVLYYAWRSTTRKNYQTRLFIVEVLLSLALSMVEIIVLQGRAHDMAPVGLMAWLGDVYFIISVPLIAILTLLAVSLAFDRPTAGTKLLVYGWVYGYSGLVMGLLVATSWVVAGFAPFSTYTYTHVPGPLYWMYEWFLVINLTLMTLLPVYGLREGRSELARSQCKLWIVTATPLATLIVAIVIMLHFGLTIINSTVTVPLLLALHLAAVGYVVHNTRIIDLDFYRPGSRVRRQKTAFYRRLLEFLQTCPPVGSKQEIVDRLSELLGCPVALANGRTSCRSGDSGELMAQIPLDMLETNNRIIIAQEIRNAHPQVHALMERYEVAAIFALYPYSRAGAHWLILGSGFSTQVHTPMDFRVVGLLLERAAGWCLDNTLADLSRNSGVYRKTPNVEGATANFSGCIRSGSKPTVSAALSLDKQIAEIECQIIRDALECCEGRQAEAARMLGIKANTLHYKMRRCGITARRPGYSHGRPATRH